jgi:Flp pilus assembly protein CpaB
LDYYLPFENGGIMRLGRMILLLSLILIVVFAGVYSLSNSQNQGSTVEDLEATQAAQSMVDVVFTRVPISRGDRITADKIGVTQLPKNALFGADDGEPDLMFTQVEEVVGLFANYDLDQGAFLSFKMVV